MQVLSIHAAAARALRVFAGLFLFALAGSVLAQSVVERAKALLRDGKALEAYELLEPAAGELNDAESAYLLGIAALDSGKAGLAVIAFERALGYDPTFAPARAELVRALIATGETDQARTELARLRPEQVPPQVQPKLAALQRQLAEAVDVARRKTSGISAYLQGEAGYDSNMNTGANSATITIPLFGGATATLDQVFTKKASAFAGVGGGLLGFNEVQPGLRLFAGIDGKSRFNSERLGSSNFEMNTASGNAGVRWQQGPHSLTGAATYLENNVGGQRLDEQLGAYGQWQYQWDANNELGLFGQWLDQKHPIQRTLDTRLTLLGVGWRHGFESPGTPVLSLAGYYGDDKEQGTDPSVGRRLVGARLGYERTLPFGARLITSLARQWSWYGGENIFFLRTRNDVRTDAFVGLAFTPWKDVTVTPQYVLTRNSSNIPVVDFTRHQLLVTIRKDFY